MPNPRVFISYSHDSPAHRDTVLELANKLRSEGVDAILDRYVNGSPPEGWPRWMLNELERASHVICVCTESYYRRFRGHDASGKGVNWEGAIITQELYDKMGINTKFIPVVFSPSSATTIPEPLRGATHYKLPGDHRPFYDAILGQAGFEAPPLGDLKRKSRSVSESSKSDDHETPPHGGDKPTQAELDSVFVSVVKEIEELLPTTPELVKFLGPAGPPAGRFLTQQNGNWGVHAGYRCGRANVSPVLRSVSDRIRTLRAPRHEWDALELVTGGILVLGMDPHWIWEQRRRSGDGTTFFPKHAAEVHTGAAGKAQFLAVIAAALASGCARLERVFGPIDSKRVPDIPTTMPGITDDDRSAEIKRHFIQFVLGPNEEFSVDSLAGEGLNTLFNRVRQLLRLARTVDNDPFYVRGENLAKISTQVKAHLDLSDLYLFVPAESGDESSLMTDPVIALSLAQRIHKSIPALRQNL